MVFPLVLLHRYTQSLAGRMSASGCTIVPACTMHALMSFYHVYTGTCDWTRKWLVCCLHIETEACLTCVHGPNVRAWPSQTRTVLRCPSSSQSISATCETLTPWVPLISSTPCHECSCPRPVTSAPARVLSRVLLPASCHECSCPRRTLSSLQCKQVWSRQDDKLAGNMSSQVCAFGALLVQSLRSCAHNPETSCVLHDPACSSAHHRQYYGTGAQFESVHMSKIGAP
jgi:hypothetical protein